MTPAIEASDQPQPAGVGRRLAAYLIDVLISLVPVIITNITLRTLARTGAWVPPPDPRAQWVALGSGAKSAVLVCFVFSTGVLYFILCHASPWQATFGKRWLNIFVAGDNGERISNLRSAGRWLVMFLAAIFGGSLVSLVTIAASDRGKALHDFAAHTVVLTGRPAVSGPLGWWRVAVFMGIPILWFEATFLMNMGSWPAIPHEERQRVACVFLLHSHRSAASGAIRVARRAGIALAAIPAASITPSTAP
jgi:uncharacterized RDD family membrane protein YckC